MYEKKRKITTKYKKNNLSAPAHSNNTCQHIAIVLDAIRA